MTSNKPKVTLVPVEQLFDEDKMPSCDGCQLMVFRNYVASCTHLGSAWEKRSYKGLPYRQQVPGPECPVHHPETTKEAL